LLRTREAEERGKPVVSTGDIAAVPIVVGQLVVVLPSFDLHARQV